MAYNFDEIYGEEPAQPSTAPAAPPARLADGGYDFDSIYGAEPATATPQAAVQASIYDASFGNPDEAAQRRQVARDLEKFLGDTTPAGVIDIPDAQRRLRVAEADHATRASPRTSAWLSNAENAAIAADDAKTLAQLEGLTSTLGGMARGVAKGATYDASAAIAGAALAPLELGEQGLRALGLPEWAAKSHLAEVLRQSIRSAQKVGATFNVPGGETTVERGLFSGAQSLGQNLAVLPAGMAARSGELATRIMALMSGGSSYVEARAEGAAPLTALSLAAPDAVAEYATEKFGMKALFDQPAFKSAFLKQAAKFTALEMGGEQVATVWQDFNRWMVLNPEKTLDDFIAERPEAAAQTAIATLVGAGGQIALVRGIDAVFTKESDGAQVEAGAQTLQELFAAAEQSLTRGRDTQTFEAFFQDVAGDATVFVDPVVLRQAAEQAGIDEARLPSLTEQSAEAANVGAGVEIPVAELVSAFTGTGIEQQIIENTRMAPDAATLAEVRADGTKAMEFFQAEAAKALEQATQQEEFRTAAETVRNDVLTEIKAAAPESITTQQQEGYASLVGSFYSTIASRMGITPLQLRDGWTDAAGVQHRGYRLGVLNEQMRAARMTGQQFDQAFRQSANDFLTAFDAADTIELVAPTTSEKEIDRAQTEFLSHFPKTGRYPRDTRLLARIRRASEKALDALDGSPETDREVASTLGPFSAYNVGAEVLEGDSLNPNGSLRVTIFGKEQVEAGLTDEPALTITVTADGELTLNGPSPNTATFEEFKARGWADYARGADGTVQTGWSALKDPANPDKPLPITQILPLLADTHARVREWRGEDYVGMHWTRATGALGGLFDQDESAVFFQGQTESENFRRWSKGNKIVTLDDSQALEFAAGEPVVVEALHGTTADFTKFERNRANIESDLGGGFYFTNTPTDVGENYAGLGPDLTNKVERLAEQIADETEREYDDPDVVAEARQRFMANEGLTMPVFVRFDNPVVLGGGSETFLGYEESYDEETEEYGEPAGDLVKLIEVLRETDTERFGDADIEQAIGDLMDRAPDNAGLTAREAIDVLSTSEGLQYATDYESDTGALASKEIIRQAFENAGFDGFIDQTVNQKFGSEKRVGKAMAGMAESTVHFIAFKPTQIKSRLGNIGAFSPTDPDILRQGAQQRGAFSPRTLDISFLANADASTFLHETGHFFLTVYADLASQPDAPAEIKADMDALLKWFGVTGQEKGLPGGADLGQAAYHGSPYRFDKFSLEHLGKGEGAQAFGWGLYFAGKREIAEYYREALSIAPPAEYKIDGVTQFTGTPNQADPREAVIYAIANGSNPAKLASHFEDQGVSADFVGGVRAAVAALSGKKIERVDTPVGQLYEVTIPEDGEYLLWDKPLSEQPEKVRAALKGAEVKNRSGQDMLALDPTGAEIISALGKGEAASKYLHSLGIAGIKYADATARGKTEDSFNYVIFDENAVEIAQTFYQGGEVPAPGPLPAGRTPLEVWNALSLDQQRPYHEQFAETFEQYLFTGKAPTKELQPLFRRFAKWLTSVYGSIRDFVARNKGARLNEEVSAIFDRMIATDAEIEAMRAARAYTQLFRNAAEAGMSPADFAAYQALDPESISEAEEQLRTRGLRDMKWLQNRRNKVIAELQEEAKARRAEVRAEVEKEVAERPLYRAMRFLKRGETTAPDGTEIKAEAGHKLRIADVEAIFPTAEGVDLRKLGYGRYGMLAEEGLPPDMVAEIFGFSSGETLVRQLLDAPKFSDEVEGLTDQRMLEQYGDLSSPQDIERAADEAIHNDARTRMVATELHFLGKSIGKPGVLIKAAREYARQIVETKSLKTLKPANFAAEETRAGKAAMEALRKGDREEAARLKRTELLNHAAAKEAFAAAKEMEKIVNRLKKIADTKDEAAARSREMDMVNATRAILAEFGIGRHGAKAAAYLKTVEALDPDMSAALDDIIAETAANARDYRTLPLRELRELGSMVDAIWSMAKSAKQVQVEGKRLQLDDVRRELTDKLLETAKAPKKPKGLNLTKAETAKVKFARLATQMKRPEAWVGMKDGADTFGPWRRYIWKTINDAQTALTQEKAARLKQMKDLVRPVLQDMIPQRIEAPEIGVTFGASDTLGYSELLHALLHTGNESNKRKLLLGRGWATERADGTLDTTKWDALIARLHSEGKLTKRHWDFVQSVWDFMEDLKPGAQRAHKEAFGRYFDEVTAAPIDTPFGQYKGGYVPARPDRLQVADADLKAMTEAGWNSMLKAFPTSRRGFTKGRVEYNVILELNLQSLTRHVDEVLTFTHMNGPVRDVQRILKGGELSSVLAVQDREAINYLILPWLQHAAQQTVTLQGNQNWENWKIWSKLRSRTGAAIMFANLKNVTQQLTSFFPAMLKVKPTYLLHSAATNILAPRDLAKHVSAMSPYMNQRINDETYALASEIDGILLNPTKLEHAQHWSVHHAYFLQMAVDNWMAPTIWLAKYNETMESAPAGMTADEIAAQERKAIELADSAVRMTQGAMRPIDVAAFEGGSPFARMFTQFAGFFSTQINMMGEQAVITQQMPDVKKKYARLGMIAFLGWYAPAIASEIISMLFAGGPPDEDKDGEYLDDWLRQILVSGPVKYATAMVPIAGQGIQAVVNAFNDKPYDDRLGNAPAIGALESAGKAAGAAYKLATDPDYDPKPGPVIRDTGMLLSLLTGLPVLPAAKSIGYLTDVESGRISPTSPADLVRGTITGVASPGSKQ